MEESYASLLTHCTAAAAAGFQFVPPTTAVPRNEMTSVDGNSRTTTVPTNPEGTVTVPVFASRIAPNVSTWLVVVETTTPLQCIEESASDSVPADCT